MYANLHKVHHLHLEGEARSGRNFSRSKITDMAKTDALNFLEVFASLHNQQTKKGTVPLISLCSTCQREKV